MRHPYLTLMVIGLATVGAVSITEKVKCFFQDKTKCVGNMICSMKKSEKE